MITTIIFITYIIVMVSIGIIELNRMLKLKTMKRMLNYEMNKPFKFTVICDKTKTVKYQTNQQPIISQLQTYEPTEIEGQLILRQTKTAYLDARYEAKLRLYKYVMFKKYGVKL